MAEADPDIAILDRWLEGRSLSDWREEFDERGYIIFESVLDDGELTAIRSALAPWIDADIKGRNDFEGLRTNRIYALLAKSPVFADLVTHPLALAFAEADLGRDCLLSACLAINLQPGETVQPWHFDDSHYAVARPRESWGVSTFWAIDAMTEDNGATEILPGSHEWADAEFAGSIRPDDFARREICEGMDPGAHPDAIRAVMPAGSLMIAKGTLWHRGGANRSVAPRLLITPQYCPGWTRQLENMALAVPPEKARDLPVRARELLGYSIHPPFMGYVDGMHPERLIAG
ncbi:MAG: phytanoyl-CoA dioxygenase family protein [Blastomonas sp.]